MERLRQRADFLAVADGARANAAAFVLQARRRDDSDPARIGFTVTKKVGNAPERNRIRRRLRQIVHQTDAVLMRPGSDYVLIGRRAALHRTFATMLDDFHAALSRVARQTPRRSAGRTLNDETQ